jgi:hypothetical protein
VLQDPASARIGFLGAYSIDNPGDRLIGYATREEVRRLLPHMTPIMLSPALPDPPFRHDLSPAQGLGADVVQVPLRGWAWARDLGLDALVIGGGGLLLLHPAFRPFLPAAPPDGPGVPAAWNALCSQGQPWYLAAHAADYQAVAACCQHLRYVSVRNQTTLRFVRRCGFAGPVQVVPDPALLLGAADMPDALPIADRYDAEADEALRRAGVPPGRASTGGRLLVGVSLGGALRDPRAGAFFDDLFAALSQLQAAGAQVLFFSFGGIYGDAAHARAAAARLPGARSVDLAIDPEGDARLSPLGLFRLIGRLDLAIVTRLHAMYAAYAQDVPFLVLDEYLTDEIASSKIREFIADEGLEPLYLCPFLAKEPSRKLAAVLQSLGRFSFRPGVSVLRRRIRAHVRDMVSHLGLSGMLQE